MEFNSQKLKALMFYLDMSVNTFYNLFKEELKIGKTYLYKLITGTKPTTKALNMRFTQICVEVLEFEEQDFDQVITLSEIKYQNN